MKKCTIYSYSTSLHVSQIYTGFSMLSQCGEIELVQKLKRFRYSGRTLMKDRSPCDFHGLFATIDGEKTVYYDLKDGWEMDREALEVADAYFKRSYLHSAIDIDKRSRVFPLGLNYELYPDRRDRYEFFRDVMRLVRMKGARFNLARTLYKMTGIRSFYLPRVSHLSSEPKHDQEPAVIFMVRAWEPDDHPPGLPEKEREERVRLNKDRADCIALLRKELGGKFYGGFFHREYAVNNFRELLVPDKIFTVKKNYLQLLKRYPICIATNGLHGSIGWKMGEYVALSKAIVSEKLKYSVPGNFVSGRNYLEFTTPEQCVEQTLRLIENEELRRRIMDNNLYYYNTYLKPDRLVLRTITL